MDITVSVEKIDLGDYIGSHLDEDGDRVPGGTVGDAIVRQLVDRITREDSYKGLTDRVRTIRDEEIREQLKPLVAEALAAPIKRTNSWGETSGAETTLREVIVDEARKWMNTKANDNYGRTTDQTHLRVMIRKAVEAAFEAEIADAVKAAKESVTAQLGATIGDRVSSIVRDALAKR